MVNVVILDNDSNTLIFVYNNGMYTINKSDNTLHNNGPQCELTLKSVTTNDCDVTKYQFENFCIASNNISQSYWLTSNCTV